MENNFFVQVILPLALPRTYTYSVPQELQEKIIIGQRITVQFGKKKFYSAIVHRIHREPPKDFIPKPITSIIDEKAIVNEKQMKLWEWLANYYLCSLGEVMNAALPAGLKLESETALILHPDFKDDFQNLNDEEYLIAEALSLRKELSIEEMQNILEKKMVYPIVKSLLEKNVAMVKENLIERYKPKVESFISLSEEFHGEEKLKNLLDDLVKKDKQLNVLMAFLDLARKKNPENIFTAEIRKSDLLKRMDSSDSPLKTLIKNGVLKIFEKETARMESETEFEQHDFKLTPTQTISFNEIKENFIRHDVVLLHGVTSSGKTQIYTKLIEETIAEGKQVLYLLPEIALTAQIIHRLRKYFGNQVGIYHSKLNSNERVEVWNKVMGDGRWEMGDGKNQLIILGARSALFLPFNNLGLIIVDEEHDTSYKQVEPTPRYHARDSAIYLANIHKAKVLMGTATPSLESYYNACPSPTLPEGEGGRKSKYGFVRLAERFGNMEMPEIKIVDLKEEKKNKLLKSHFSSVLLNELENVLKNKEQAILFQNRRGFAKFLECGVCNWIPHCRNCDVSLTYHKFLHELKCHYCGYTQKPVTTCLACGSNDIKIQGFGTEKVEDELQIFFPEAKIDRMDFDTVKSKEGHNKIIAAFENHEIDILVGTQMVTKGLDFEKVSLVGILSADQLINFPDFRAIERAFQLMSQVGGRAGRRNKRGKVIIQTLNPNHPLLNDVKEHDYESFYKHEIFQREKFRYPPFYRLIQITLKHKKDEVVSKAAIHFAENLKKIFGKKLLGPTLPGISRIRNYFLRDVLLKLEREKDSVNKAKEFVRVEIEKLQQKNEFKSVVVVEDVDPY